MQLTSSSKGTPFWQHKQKSSVNQTVIFSRMIYDSFWKPIGLLLQWDAMAGRLNSLRWFLGFALRTSTAQNIETSKIAAAFKAGIIKKDNTGRFCNNKTLKRKKCVSDIMKNRRLAYKSRNFETSVSETGVWEETRSSALSEKCTAEVNLSPSPNNCGKTSMVTPQFYSTHREKMPSSMIYPTLKIFSFVDVQIFFSNNCCDVMLGVLSERGSTDRRAYYSPLWCF